MSAERVRSRTPAVAGQFYPGRPADLAAIVDEELSSAAARLAKVLDREHDRSLDRQPKALIVPHAGYIYSGSIAASGYARLLPWRDRIRRVVLLGPAHRVPVRSMAVSSADAWMTPLGSVALDKAALARVLELPGVVFDDDAHAPEHSLEVHLPFLQRVLGEGWTLVPIVVGQADRTHVADVLDAVWGGDETLIVISTDLSHYHDHATAQQLDRDTATAILAGDADAMAPARACGAYPVRGLLTAAGRHHLDIELVDLRNSGDTAGPADRVVGYAAFVLTPRRDGSIDATDASATTDAAGVAHAAGVAETAGVAHAAGVAETAGVADAADAAGTAEAGRGATGPVEPGAPSGLPDRAGVAGDDDAPFTNEAFDATERAALLTVAEEAIRARLDGRPRSAPEPASVPASLRRPGAAFVTLRDGERLLGCIGTIEPTRPLLDDVADNAVGAAFRDPRMPPLTADEFATMSLHVSVLTPAEPMDVSSRAELLAAVRPGVDGLVIEAGRHRATYLPSVWEQLPDPDAFLDHLWQKAGLRAGTWPKGLRVAHYQTVEFGDDGPRRAIGA
jgi:AmmeMemoRadiSam system protein B/AmmeMemoRadiSam system protein A